MTKFPVGIKGHPVIYSSQFLCNTLPRLALYGKKAGKCDPWALFMNFTQSNNLPMHSSISRCIQIHKSLPLLHSVQASVHTFCCLLDVIELSWPCKLILFFNTESLHFSSEHTQQAFTCSKLTIETLEQGVKYVQS